ncbi:MAG: AAA family ATPase [Actinomycetota bacterium]|nr:AAA family ATPase [Actinomycetota bacterium]
MSGRTVVTSRLARDIVAEEQRFLWHDRIPVGHITIIAGAPAKGKSTLGYRIAADTDVMTLFVTTEEIDKSVWRPRVEAAGMDLSKAAHHREVKFSKDPRDLAYLAKLVERYEAKLVVVDPLTNHLRGASIHRDEQIRELFEPYVGWLDEAGVALVLQMHVLKSVNPKHHPLNAVPAGVASVGKAVYIFGDDPTFGADENIRVLANASKFNFGPVPASLRFEYATAPVRVRSRVTGKCVQRDYGFWTLRGETTVTAKALLVVLAPETKERKTDRIVFLLIELLKGGPVPVSVVRQAISQVDPPTSWRTAERVATEMGIELIDDEQDKRKKWWKLPDSTLAVYEEITEPDDEIQIEEVDVPHTLPEEWTDDDEGD